MNPATLRVALAILLGAGLSGGCSGPQEPVGGPAGGITTSGSGRPATIRVERRDIYSTIRLEGIVEAYDAVPVPAAKAGNFVPTPGLANGRPVSVGDTIGKIEVCVPAATPAATPSPAPEGPPPCTITRTNVTAPVGGLLSGLYPQAVAAGAPVAAVQPPGFHAKLPVVEPAALFSFQNPPKTGKAELVGGPAGFVVTYESLVYVKDSGAVNVFASIPADVPAFAGLRAIVVFVTNVKDKVPTLPLSAVRGRAGSGQVVVLEPDGRKRTAGVTIGAADDAYVEVTGLDPALDVVLYPLESDFAG
ncbi:hypothetical protein GCM10027610_031420 [Dactylosporangium cerinum]